MDNMQTIARDLRSQGITADRIGREINLRSIPEQELRYCGFLPSKGVNEGDILGDFGIGDLKTLRSIVMAQESDCSFPERDVLQKEESEISDRED